jgi:hypothetical protein
MIPNFHRLAVDDERTMSTPSLEGLHAKEKGYAMVEKPHQG